MNRVDKLANQYKELCKKYDELSYGEQSEFREKVDIRQPIEIQKVSFNQDQAARDNAQSTQTIDFVLVESATSQEQYQELATSAAEEGMVLDDDDISLFYHVRPKWMKEPQQIIEKPEHYIAEFLCQEVITIQIGYDRSKLLDLFKSILTLGLLLHSHSNSSENSVPFQMEKVIECIFRGENYDRYVSDIEIKWNAGTQQEFTESLEIAAKAIRQIQAPYPKWAEFFELIDNTYAAEIESGFTTMIAMKIIETIKRYFLDLGTGIWSSTGEVSREVYDFLSHDKLTYVRPRSRGGSDAEYNLTELLKYYKYVLPTWQQAKRDAIQAQRNPLKKHIWREIIKPYALPDDLIEWLNESETERIDLLEKRTDLPYLQERLIKGYALTKPSELALEDSARFCRVPPYYYSVSHLFGLLPKKQKR